MPISRHNSRTKPHDSSTIFSISARFTLIVKEADGFLTGEYQITKETPSCPTTRAYTHAYHTQPYVYTYVSLYTYTQCSRSVPRLIRFQTRVSPTLQSRVSQNSHGPEFARLYDKPYVHNNRYDNIGRGKQRRRRRSSSGQEGELH